jgi:hypothetical protein
VREGARIFQLAAKVEPAHKGEDISKRDTLFAQSLGE